MWFGNPPPKPEQNQTSYTTIRPASSVQPVSYTLKTESDFGQLLYGNPSTLGRCGFCGKDFWRSDGDECPTCYTEYREALDKRIFPSGLQKYPELLDSGKHRESVNYPYTTYCLLKYYEISALLGKISQDEADWARSKIIAEANENAKRMIEQYRAIDARDNNAEQTRKRVAEISPHFHPR